LELFAEHANQKAQASATEKENIANAVAENQVRFPSLT
jgi:hypothetical protein